MAPASLQPSHLYKRSQHPFYWFSWCDKIIACCFMAPLFTSMQTYGTIFSMAIGARHPRVIATSAHGALRPSLQVRYGALYLSRLKFLLPFLNFYRRLCVLHSALHAILAPSIFATAILCHLSSSQRAPHGTFYFCCGRLRVPIIMGVNAGNIDADILCRLPSLHRALHGAHTHCGRCCPLLFHCGGIHGAFFISQQVHYGPQLIASGAPHPNPSMFSNHIGASV